ncbi:hypothetical protein SacmaDRAFT_1351 [Saccharomonospora marina XMU15]|uniref:Methylase involved in ubiquinone/menaquinone biosynthesis n=1 Tax=Saccharomonospora marina XMU15 TaxID=882083 RepID=H5WZG8_9PSEU|nr:rRNA (guanine-N1)-methyltransferase [Saccharomonospora marina]EHR49630.1 hypothetical protein SacmaDRAFT_1351 [Saccharomonospora marina XMU15]
MTSPKTSAKSLPSAVVAALRCSVCGEQLRPGDHWLRCDRGHSFDIARQGYVNLLHAKVPAKTADTAEMVAARVRFLETGCYAPLADLLADRAQQAGGEFVVDAGAGTGYYLARVLRRLRNATGLALDVSAAALRRAARAHPSIGAAVWNLWQPWPVSSGVADVLLNVFAPRNPGEFHRVLRPGGTLLVVVPGQRHLDRLADTLGLLDMADDKQRRLTDALAQGFAACGEDRLDATVTLTPEQARAAVLMGPNAHHLHRGDLAARLDAIREPIEVTTSFRVSSYRRLG